MAAVKKPKHKQNYEMSLSKDIHKKVEDYSSRIRALQSVCYHPEGFPLVERSNGKPVGECPYCYKDKFI